MNDVSTATARHQPRCARPSASARAQRSTQHRHLQHRARRPRPHRAVRESTRGNRCTRIRLPPGDRHARSPKRAQAERNRRSDSVSPGAIGCSTHSGANGGQRLAAHASASGGAPCPRWHRAGSEPLRAPPPRTARTRMRGRRRAAAPPTLSFRQSRSPPPTAAARLPRESCVRIRRRPSSALTGSESGSSEAYRAAPRAGAPRAAARHQVERAPSRSAARATGAAPGTPSRAALRDRLAPRPETRDPMGSSSCREVAASSGVAAAANTAPHAAADSPPKCGSGSASPEAAHRRRRGPRPRPASRDAHRDLAVGRAQRRHAAATRARADPNPLEAHSRVADREAAARTPCRAAPSRRAPG